MLLLHTKQMFTHMKYIVNMSLWWHHTLGPDVITVNNIFHLHIYGTWRYVITITYIHIILYIHTYTYTHAHISTTCTYLLTDFDECADGIGRNFFPFGPENGDLSSFIPEYGRLIELKTDFVFHRTNYTTVFVSL